MPCHAHTPGERKSVQARILEYAETIDWTFVPHEKAEERRAAFYPTAGGIRRIGRPVLLLRRMRRREDRYGGYSRQKILLSDKTKGYATNKVPYVSHIVIRRRSLFCRSRSCVAGLRLEPILKKRLAGNRVKTSFPR